MLKDKEQLKIIEAKGNLFNAPPCTLIIHACNCIGSWGAGIATEFKEKYPCAYSEYIYVCTRNNKQILGKSHIVFPATIFKDQINEAELSTTHFIGCIFTSYFYGKFRGTEQEILDATYSSVKHILKKVTEWNLQINEYSKIEEIRMCRINSGYFGVPWNKTKKVLENIIVDDYSIKELKVISL